MHFSETSILFFVMIFLILIAMIGVWNNWNFIGKNGFHLPRNQRPGFFHFWFLFFPRRMLGMRTRMDDMIL